jgi:hypothetical protein
VASSSNAAAFAATCEHAVSSLQLKSGSVLPLTANPTYAAALGSIIGKLNAARAADDPQLAGAKDQPGQAKAADRLAQAHAQAATDVSKLTPGPIGADGNATIAAALRRLSGAYTALAKAARHNDKRGYDGARSTIAQATKDLSSGFAQLRQDGYSVG